jgi:polyisoprenoid-binding protein YceI
MKRLYSIIIVLVLSLINVHTVFATSPTWELDKNHSNIYFTVDHIFSKIRGHFGDFSAKIQFSPDNVKDSNFSFEIKVDSIDTAIAKRDKHLLSGDFFDAGKFPSMTFTSNQITDKGNGHFDVTGILTIKGQEFPLTLPFVLAGVKDHPAAKGKEVAGFNGTVSIDRLAMGVGSGKFYKMGVVGKEVEILVSLEVMKDK